MISSNWFIIRAIGHYTGHLQLDTDLLQEWRTLFQSWFLECNDPNRSKEEVFAVRMGIWRIGWVGLTSWKWVLLLTCRIKGVLECESCQLLVSSAGSNCLKWVLLLSFKASQLFRKLSHSSESSSFTRLFCLTIIIFFWFEEHLEKNVLLRDKSMN